MYFKISSVIYRHVELYVYNLKYFSNITWDICKAWDISQNPYDSKG